MSVQMPVKVKASLVLLVNYCNYEAQAQARKHSDWRGGGEAQINISFEFVE